MLALALAVLAGAAVAAGLAFLGGGDRPPIARAQAGERPPNIVVVMTDDQDARTMWAMPKTRRLLMKQGTRFLNSYASFPSCCPSRATLLTGQYAHNHGVHTNLAKTGGGYPALDHDNTLPLWLRTRAPGYRTAHVGRYLNEYGTPAGRPMTKRRAALEVPPGWNHWFAPVYLTDPFEMYNYTLNQNGRLVDYKDRPRDYQTDVYARHATRLVRRHAADRRPLFLSFAPLAPHGEVPAPRTGPNPRPARRHRDAYPRLSLPRPPSFNRRDESKPPRIANLPRLTRENFRNMLRRYRGRIRSLLAVDDAVAEITRELRRAGELTNTLIIFTSDQGLLLGEHRIVGRKVHPYEEAVRVPLILYGPGLGVPAGEIRRQVTANVDLAPTILDAAGIDPPTHAADGVSLLPLAESEDEAGERAILLHDLRPNRRRTFSGVRSPGWVYIEHQDNRRNEELYDLDEDAFQLQNLLKGSPDPAAHLAKREQMRAALRALEGCEGDDCEVRVPSSSGWE